MNSADQKQRLRQQMREQRRSLSATDSQTYANALCEVFKSWISESHFPIALYLSFDGEINPMPVIEYCWASEKPVYLPVVMPGQGHLLFAHYTKETRLEENQYGILQPQVENLVEADTLHTLLMPLTAFDVSGARLGMGGGYYDKTLARCHNKPDLIGLAYEFQEVEKCPVEAHDEPLDGVMTNTKYINFS